MYLFRTKLDVSPIHGIGVFAEEPIGKDAVVWRFNPIFEVQISVDSIAMESLPAWKREWLDRHATTSEDGDTWIASIDHKMYTNHSKEPLLKYQPRTNIFIAVRDIEIGEELTMDYSQYSHSPYAQSLR